MLTIIFWIILIFGILVIIYAGVVLPLSDKNEGNHHQPSSRDEYRADNFQYQDPEDDSIEDRMRRDESDAEQQN